MIVICQSATFANPIFAAGASAERSPRLRPGNGRSCVDVVVQTGSAALDARLRGHDDELVGAKLQKPITSAQTQTDDTLYRRGRAWPVVLQPTDLIRGLKDHEPQHTPCRFPWMPGTKVGQDDYADTASSECI